MPKIQIPKIATPPNPGSDAALHMGCRCPVMDNSYGQGYYRNPKVFVVNAACAVHNLNKEGKKNASEKK